jgi:hypothetical protein
MRGESDESYPISGAGLRHGIWCFIEYKFKLVIDWLIVEAWRPDFLRNSRLSKLMEKRYLFCGVLQG